MTKGKYIVGQAVKCMDSVDWVYERLLGLTGVITKVYGGNEHADYEVVFPTTSKIHESLSSCTFAMMESELEEYQMATTINKTQLGIGE